MDDTFSMYTDHLHSPSQVSESPSQPPIAAADLVKWQNTQPLPALSALIRDSFASRPARRALHSTLPSTSLFPDGLSSPDASSSKLTSTTPATRRPTLRRARPRFSDSTLYSGSTDSAPSLFTLNHSFGTGDSKRTFVDILKDASKFVDKNARIKKRSLVKKINQVASQDLRARKVKAPGKTTAFQDELNGRKEVSSQNAHQEKGRRKAFESFVSMDVDHPDHNNNFPDMDVDIPVLRYKQGGRGSTLVQVASSSKMPPPPLPAKVGVRFSEARQPPPLRIQSTSSNLQLRPQPPPPVPPPPSTPTFTQNPPTSSNPRRPLLGMRRVINPNANTNDNNPFVPSQKPLPTKQKGFKPPFAKPPSVADVNLRSSHPQHGSFSTTMLRSNKSVSGGARSASTDSITAASTMHNNGSSSPRPPQYSSGPNNNAPVKSTTAATGITASATKKRAPKSPQTLTSEEADADSSFSEYSFDMDLLEEVLKQYDEK